LCAHLAPKRIRIDVVDERPLAVDLHDGQPLAVLRLEFRVASDIDLFELERKLSADALDDPASTLAQVAPLSVVERDSTDRCRASW
jgi:hypothetical protein